MMKSKIIALIITSFLHFSLVAQQNELYKASLTNTDSAGYKIVALTPNIRSIANNDLRDIRLFDNKNLQIPYFAKEFDTVKDVNFIPIENDITFSKKSTIILINNDQGDLFKNFTLQVSNADVYKTCKIEGSNDKKKWFVISEKIHLSLINNSSKSFNYYDIPFPAIDYKSIRIVIEDSLSAPINIKSIGYFKSEIFRKRNDYNTIDHLSSFSQEKKSTLIHVQMKRDFHIDRMKFVIKKPELFKRNLKIYTQKEIDGKLLKNTTAKLILNSNNNNTFSNLDLKLKDFWIEIENKDNQPLTIESILFSQKVKYIVADLIPNQTYTITAGDTKLRKPSYDIDNFKNTIIVNSKNILNINKETFFHEKTVENKLILPFYEKPWFMWLCIGFVSIIILYFTISLINNTKQE